MTTAIDAHHHFWSIARSDYGWLTSELSAIYRDFGPEDLGPLLADAGIGRTILVQAAASEAETDYLLAIAARTDFVAGVVGWVDLARRDAPDRVAALAARPGLVGLRPMLQSIDDTDWLLRDDVARGIAAMVAHGLRFDALVQPRHLPMLDRFAADWPALPIVIDHGAKPAIAAGMKAAGMATADIMAPWARDMAGVARHANVHCKLSGLATEAGAGWQAADLAPYVTVLLDAFGPARLLWGSDWPVLNLAGDYAGWAAMRATLLSGLDAADRTAIEGGNAARFYGINGA